VVQVHVTPRGGERYSLVPDGTTFALGPAVLARGDDPPEPPVPGFARPVAETVGAGLGVFLTSRSKNSSGTTPTRVPWPAWP
jgi:hypothetical protein